MGMFGGGAVAWERGGDMGIGAVAWDREGDKGVTWDRGALDPGEATRTISNQVKAHLCKRIHSPSTRLRSTRDPTPLPFRASTSLLAGLIEGSFSLSLLAFGTWDALSLGAMLGVFVCLRSRSRSLSLS